MAAIPLFTSVPGELVPGMGQPALIAVEPPVTSFQYYGHMPLIYLDYLDVSDGQTLVALPGGSYLMTPVNSRRGLTIPPPDGRWDPHTVKDFAVLHPPGSAAWDRVAHRGLAAALPPLTLAQARAAIGPGFVPAPLVPAQVVVPVVHPAGSAAWDRVAHSRRVFAVPVSLREARARAGPGDVPPPLIPAQREAPAVVHPEGSAAWDRAAHATLRPSVAPQPSLAEVRVRIEAAKAERGFWDTGQAAPEPVPVAAQRVMPAPEPTELQKIRAALAAGR